MPQYNTILCAIDFSAHSKRALRLATELARRFQGTVIALHVVDFLLAEAAAAAYQSDRLEKDAEAELRALVDAEVGPGSGIRAVVRKGRPEQLILPYAAECGADLIAMGTHGLGGVRKLFFGSVTEKVLRAVTLPVLAVPFHEEQRPDDPIRLGTVLAALDFEAQSNDVAAHAAGLAAELRLPLVLVHAIPRGPSAPYATDAVDLAAQAQRQEAEGRLDEVVRMLPRELSITTETCLGSVPEAIASFAATLPGAIVVIGLGSRGRLLHRPGTTAYRLLSLSNVPMIALPASAEG